MGPIGFSGALSLLSWPSRRVTGPTSPALVPFGFGRRPLPSQPGTFYGRLALSRISRRPVAAVCRGRAGPGDFETPGKLEETKKRQGKNIEGREKIRTDVYRFWRALRREISPLGNKRRETGPRTLFRLSLPSYGWFRRYNPSLSPPFVGNKKLFCKTLIVIFKWNTDKRRINNPMNVTGGHGSFGKGLLHSRSLWWVIRGSKLPPTAID